MKKFTISLRNRYDALEDQTPAVEDDEEVERDFKIMEEAYTSTAEEVLGRPQKKRKPWISGESWDLVNQRELINNKILSAKSVRLKNQQRLKYVEKDREVKRSIKAGQKEMAGRNCKKGRGSSTKSTYENIVWTNENDL